MANKPKIRFKGFDDAWEQRKLGDVVTFINGRAYSQEELLSNGKYKVLRVGNFYTNDSWYYSDMELEAKYYAKEGDLLYTWSATFGPHIWHGDKVIYHYHIWKVELSDALEKHFAVQLLEKDKQSILSDKNGSTMVHITKAGMESKEVMLPPNIREQTKIGECFQNLDNLITLHQRKCDQMKELKKYMLKKMFPQNGAKVPEIRFDGFTDDWEQRKLNELLKKYEDPVDTPHNGYERIGIRSHAKGTFHSFVEPGKELDTAKMHRVASDKFILNITFAWEHAVAITNENDAGKLVSHRFPQFSFDEKLKSHFFKYLMLDRKFKEHLELSSPGGAGRNRVLKISDMLKYEIKIPSIGEQTKIAKYLDELDHLITLHQHKCNELREIKKYMLKNMFI